MLTYLEKKREEVGAETIDRDGVFLTNRELYSMFDECPQEFEHGYIMKGSVVGFGGTSIDIPSAYIDGVRVDWCERVIRIDRKGIHGDYMNDLNLHTNDLKDGYIQVYYSHSDWIDIFIGKSEYEKIGRIHLCFQPRSKE